MLYLEKKKTGDTVRIKIRNRLFYILVLDGLSVEESYRLCNALNTHISSILQNGDSDYEQYLHFTHYLWWDRQKVAVIIMTADVLDRLYEIGGNVEAFSKAIDTFEKEEIHIPFCSMNSTNFTSKVETEQKVASRVNITTNDKTGEISVNTFSEIFYGAFRI